MRKTIDGGNGIHYKTLQLTPLHEIMSKIPRSSYGTITMRKPALRRASIAAKILGMTTMDFVSEASDVAVKPIIRGVNLPKDAQFKA